MANQKTLFMREWIAISLFLGLMFSLVSISWLTRWRIEQKVISAKKAYTEQFIEIAIEGCVDNPGVYRFRPGITGREIAKLITFKKEADRKSLNTKQIFFESSRIIIEKKKENRERQRRDRLPSKSRIDGFKTGRSKNFLKTYSAMG